MHQLLFFIKRDLASYQPKSDRSAGNFASSTPFSVFDVPEVQREPSLPKSLYLIHPLFFAYEFGPVASAAQANVLVPDGLDLDAWIVPSMQVAFSDDDEMGETKAKKNRKGKEKGYNKVKSGKKKRKGEDNIEEFGSLSQLQEEIETPEERAERERVGPVFFVFIICHVDLMRSSEAKSRADGKVA